MLEIFKNLAMKSDLGKVLQHFISKENYDSFISDYIHDFTRMSYNAASDSDMSEAVDFEFKVYIFSSSFYQSYCNFVWMQKKTL